MVLLSPRWIQDGMGILLGVLALGCASSGMEDELSASSLPIVGGEHDPNTNGSVGLLAADGQYRCTAAVIAPCAVVTAAHCIVEGESGLRVALGPDLLGARIQSPIVFVHPQFEVIGRALSFKHDVAVLQLAQCVGIEPFEFAAEAPSIGASVKVVAYGRTSADRSDEGLRRSGWATVSVLAEGSFDVVPGPAQPCVLDSGGPVLDEASKLIGIVSSGDGKCAEAAHITRVDTEREFLQSHLVQTPAALPVDRDDSAQVGSASCQFAALQARRFSCASLLGVLAVLAASRRWTGWSLVRRRAQ